MSEKDAMDELDIDFEHQSAGTSFFIYINSNLRIHLIIEEHALCLEFDTSLPRKENNSYDEEIFYIPR